MRIPSGISATFWARSSANSGAAERPRLISCATPTIRATAKRSCRSMKRSWKRRRRDTRTHFPFIAVSLEKWRQGMRRGAPACRWKSGCALCSPIPKMFPNRIKSIWKRIRLISRFPARRIQPLSRDGLRIPRWWMRRGNRWWCIMDPRMISLYSATNSTIAMDRRRGADFTSPTIAVMRRDIKVMAGNYSKSTCRFKIR